MIGIKQFTHQCLMLLITLIMAISFTCAIADDYQSIINKQNKQSSGDFQAGIEVGVLTILGIDLRLFFREAESPWIYGLRYLDIEDDFVNEAAVDLPNDESDRSYTVRSGLFANYLFHPLEEKSFFLSGALYSTTLKIECNSQSDSSSFVSIYLGGGFQRQWKSGFGYRVGVLLSPFVTTKLETPECSSESNGDIDLDVSLTYIFN